jgi:hypothetical protein
MTSSGHIYKIICTLDEKFCYIGSTFNRLSKRFEKHRTNYYYWKKGDEKVKCSCFPYFDKYGVENFKIILIKTYEVCRSHVKDRKHLEAYETLWTNKTKCVNTRPAFNPLRKNKRFQSITMKRLYDPEKRKAQSKAYRESHRDETREKKSMHYESHRDEINAKMKEYYAKNRDEILARQRERRAKKKAEKEAQITV